MREVLTDNGKFKICESIKELTIDRYSDFQKYLLQDSGIGSTIEDVYRHSEKIDVFIASGKIAEAATERSNQHFNFYLMLNKINITHLTFATLVDSIDDVKIDDYSETALIKVCDQLGKVGLKREELEDVLTDIKKKLIPN